MCLISINYHPSCGCTYYTLESDCGSSSSSHPSCVQFMTFPTSGLWRSSSSSSSQIRRLSGDCGLCSGAGDSGEVLARVNFFRPQHQQAQQQLRQIVTTGGPGAGAGAGASRPDSGLSGGTGSITGTSQNYQNYNYNYNSNLKMDGLSRAVSMGIKLRNGARTDIDTVAANNNKKWSGSGTWGEGLCTIL